MTARKPASDVAYLCRALKAPSLADAAARPPSARGPTAGATREYLAACLERVTVLPVRWFQASPAPIVATIRSGGNHGDARRPDRRGSS
jgi:hypothetical protein